MISPEIGYCRARQLLKARFGNEYIISDAWVKKVTEGPIVKTNCGNAIQEIADDLRVA